VYPRRVAVEKNVEKAEQKLVSERSVHTKPFLDTSYADSSGLCKLLAPIGVTNIVANGNNTKEFHRVAKSTGAAIRCVSVLQIC